MKNRTSPLMDMDLNLVFNKETFEFYNTTASAPMSQGMYMHYTSLSMDEAFLLPYAEQLQVGFIHCIASAQLALSK